MVRSSLMLVALLAAAACGEPRNRNVIPLQPSPSQAATPVWSPLPDSSTFGGRWEGSSTVESAGGVLPECIAPSWRPGFIDAIAAEIGGSQWGPDLHLRQRASEECHLQANMSQNSLVASPWPYDEFDCAIVPSLCYPTCHFQVKSTEWGCPGTPPEVWILGIALHGRLTEGSPSRLEGKIQIGYDHRPGGSKGGGWYGATIVKTFELRKVSP